MIENTENVHSNNFYKHLTSMKIDHIYGFEKFRDGGSLVASFQGDDSCEYWVMFSIANMDCESPEYKPHVFTNR